MGAYIRVRFRTRPPLVASPSIWHRFQHEQLHKPPLNCAINASIQGSILRVIAHKSVYERLIAPQCKASRMVHGARSSPIMSVCEMIISHCACLSFCIVTLWPLPSTLCPIRYTLYAFYAFYALRSLCCPHCPMHTKKRPRPSFDLERSVCVAMLLCLYGLYHL